MTSADLDTSEMLYDVGGDHPDDAADTGIDDQLPKAPAGPPPYLSPSSASTYRSCARRWKFRYIDRLADPAGEAALAGTFAHRVLELLMEKPGVERTADQARAIARDVWPETAEDDDFIALGLGTTEERRFRWLAWTAIEGLWQLEDPAAVLVVANEQKLDTQLGGVPFRGIVDRLERENTEPDAGLIVSDYKSGRAPSARFQEGRLDQVLLYAGAVEAATGERPKAARLLYLGQCVIETEVTSELLEAAVGALEETWSSLNSAVELSTFEATPGPLCGWCPYAGGCAEGLAELKIRQSSGRIRSSAPSLRFLDQPS
ncbi:MAG: putative RecB family exonuclease [Verrucomicrobiales bacterium]|jgi:putative RecB family exonuclease